MRLIKPLLILGSLGLGAIANAQTGQYDLQLALQSVDCKAGQVFVQVQVRAKDQAHVFNMGDANYRIEYNSIQLRNPQIKSQDNFSSQAATSRNMNYSGHNLQGSVEQADKGILSLNTFYTASNSGAQEVGTQWTPVTTLKFDLVNYRTVTQLKFKDHNTFPVTGMNQAKITNPDPANFAYELNEATSSGFFGNLAINPSQYCKSVNPVVSTHILKTTVNRPIDGIFPIYNTDPDQTYTAKVLAVQHGKISNLATGDNLKLTYSPDLNYIGNDLATIQVCSNRGYCDTANIKIIVDKDGLFVFNGVSPNDDGVNDTFIIEGLEKMPNHSLSIFTPAGNEVLNAAPYKNDWDGKYEGKKLPDGTYFYVVNDGNGKTFSGYLQLAR
jgi:gliding motility-associated-like protein